VLQANGYLSLLQYITEKTGFNCASYKEKPLKRRLAVRMRALALGDYRAYQEHLRKHPDELKVLLDTIPINLSYFYRNPEVYDYFRSEVLPRLAGNRSLVLWSAGCASGEETYSIAICLAEALGERLAGRRIRVIGSDVDRDAVRLAQEGLYTAFALSYLPRSLVDRYFQKQGERFAIRSEIKKRVEFYSLDLFQSPPFAGVDVIFCRNVLIYFEKEAQRRLVGIFHQVLKPAGYLILGKTEILLGIEGFKVVNTRERVYQKVVIGQ
jgi:chemotaxis methyl-accepting protein methylase